MSEGQHWCDYCQSNYYEDHFDESDLHKVGDEYGPEGQILAVLAELRDLCKSRMTEGAGGGMVDADTIWPSEVLAIMSRTKVER